MIIAGRLIRTGPALLAAPGQDQIHDYELFSADPVPAERIIVFNAGPGGYGSQTGANPLPSHLLVKVKDQVALIPGPIRLIIDGKM